MEELSHFENKFSKWRRFPRSSTSQSIRRRRRRHHPLGVDVAVRNGQRTAPAKESIDRKWKKKTHVNGKSSERNWNLSNTCREKKMRPRSFKLDDIVLDRAKRRVTKKEEKNGSIEGKGRIRGRVSANGDGGGEGGQWRRPFDGRWPISDRPRLLGSAPGTGHGTAPRGTWVTRSPPSPASGSFLVSCSRFGFCFSGRRNFVRFFFVLKCFKCAQWPFDRSEIEQKEKKKPQKIKKSRPHRRKSTQLDGSTASWLINKPDRYGYTWK